MKGEIEVAQTNDIEKFFNFALQHYENHVSWVAPSKKATLHFFDKKNPLWKHLKKKLFVAKRDGEVVGRVAAFIDKKYQKKESVGYFGFFESVNDNQVAKSLLNACEKYFKKNSIKRMRGPIHATIFHDCGVLVENFKHVPSPLSTYNHPYYDSVLQAGGLGVSRNLHSYHLDPNKVLSHSQRDDVQIEHISKRTFDTQVPHATKIIKKSFANHFQYSDLPDSVFTHLAKNMKELIDPEFSFFVKDSATNKKVGVVLGFRNYNQVLQGWNGSLSLRNMFSLLMKKRKIDEAKISTISLLPTHHGKGLGKWMVSYAASQMKNQGMKKMEYGWVDEQNKASCALIERLGGEIYKTYRIYEKSI